MRHTGTVTLTTPRLLLRPLLPADADMMYANWASDPQVTRWLRWEAHPNAAHTRLLLQEWQPLYQNEDYYCWAIAARCSGEVFGSISLVRSGAGQRAFWQQAGVASAQEPWEPGYCIGRAWWGQGYTTEALQAVVRHWFEAVGGEWLTCSHARQNPASGAVMRKAGFGYAGQIIYHKFNGQPIDCLNYKLTAEEYFSHRQNEVTPIERTV